MNAMKPFPARQNPLDWATQYGNIVLGTRVVPEADGWLLGPLGAVRESADQFVRRIADAQGLRIARNRPGCGLVERMDDWAVAVRPGIEAFYRRTLDFDLAVDTAWRPGFGSLGHLVAILFSRRIQQLNLPRRSDSEIPIDSDIVQLVDPEGRVRHTVWHRSRRDTAEVVFFGIYTTCRIPSGDVCVKVIFPLPCGSATVVFKPRSDAMGNLSLVSAGERAGDPGFYFLVRDSRGGLWKHYLPGFRESIQVSEGDDGILTAEHTLRLWSSPVYRMRYRMVDRASGAET